MAFDGAKRWYYLIYVVPFFAALLAVWLDWLLKQRRFRNMALAGLALLVAVQVGGTSYRIYKNDYKNAFLPAVNFALQADPDHELIYGAGELGFPIGFPNYLLDDVSLGYFSGVKAKVLFVPDGYWGLWLDNMKERLPPVGRYISETLAHDYRLAYSEGQFRVYVRKEGVGKPR